MKAPLHSIALRLTLVLGLIALAVFSAAGLLLHYALERELARNDREELVGIVEVVRHFIDEARPTGDLAALQRHLDDVLIAHDNLHLWLMSADGAPVYGDRHNAVAAPATDGQLRVVRQDGVALDAIEVGVTDAAPLPIARLRVAIDTRPRQRLLAMYHGALFAVGGLGVLLTIVLSGVATWRGLAPVTRLSDAAARITPEALSNRLPDADVDRELVGLVRAFNRALDRLEGAYRQMETFNADVAHELRTPLATLIAGTQVVLASRRDAVELEETLRSHLEELDHLAATVNDMLFLARADTGDRARDLVSVDLAQQTDQVIEYYEAPLAEARLRAVRSGSARALGNPALIRRALSNLMSNAIKHSAAGSTIEVRVEADRNGARVSVFNPGTALPPEIAERVFDRLFRADAARERSADSHGLGLAIVRAVARMHGGDVWVEPSASGNRIGFRLPALGADGAPQPLGAPASATSIHHSMRSSARSGIQRRR